MKYLKSFLDVAIKVVIASVGFALFIIAFEYLRFFLIGA